MKIYTDTPEGVTVVKNAFIDQYMPQANGEFVKVYLYLLRCANTGRDLSLSSIADALEHTDKDIQRALSYWEKQDLIHIKAAPGGVIHSITFSDLPSASDEPEMRGTSFSDASAADTSRASGSCPEQAAISGSVTTYYALENSRAARTGEVTGLGTPSGDSQRGTSSARLSGTPAASSRDSQGSGVSAGNSSAPSRDRIAALAGQKDVRQIFFAVSEASSDLRGTGRFRLLLRHLKVFLRPDHLPAGILHFKGFVQPPLYAEGRAWLGRIRCHYGHPGQTGIKSLQQKLFHDSEYLWHQGPQSGRTGDRDHVALVQ